MFVLPHNVRPRRASEGLFGSLYSLCLIVNVAGFVIGFTDFYDRIENTFLSYFGSDVTFNFTMPLNIIFENCTYDAEFTLGGITTKSSMTSAAAPVGSVSMAAIVLAVFVLHGVFIILSAFAVTFHKNSVRHLRLGGTLIPVMTFLPAINAGLCFVIIALIWGSKSTRDFFNGFVDSCAAQYVTFNRDTFLGAEYDTNVVFGTNLNWVFAPILVYLGIMFFACLHHLSEGMEVGYAQLAKATFPWESGFFSKVSKSKLSEWTRRRAVLLHELEQGTLRMISPFPTFVVLDTNELYIPPDPKPPRQSTFEEGHQGAEDWPTVAFPGGDEYQSGDEVDDGATFQNAQFPHGSGWDEGVGDELDGFADEVTEVPQRRRRHRHHRREGDGQGVPEEENDGGEEPRHKHKRRHRRHRKEDDAERAVSNDTHAE